MYAKTINTESICPFLEQLNKEEAKVLENEEEEIKIQTPHHRHFVSIFPGAALAVIGICIGAMGLSLLARAVTEAVKLIITGFSVSAVGLSSIGIGYFTNGFGTARDSAIENLEINHHRAIRLRNKIHQITLTLSNCSQTERLQLMLAQSHFKETLHRYRDKPSSPQPATSAPQNTNNSQATTTPSDSSTTPPTS
jgi:hypothetical protein